MQRKILKQIKGYRTRDGAGVNLVRVLGPATVKDFDPFLMLDSFDSTNPEDYAGGFPLHPHRGIETISYVYRGKMTHRDSLGNEDTVTDGEVQWMTAGSGIMHEEKLPPSDRLLGVQLWLNMRASEKMANPGYKKIQKTDIEEIPIEGGMIRLLAGSYENKEGFMGRHLPLDYYDIHLEKGASISIKTEQKKAVMCFTLLGDAYIAGELVAEKTAVKLSEGDIVEIKAEDSFSQVLFMSSEFLGEPVAWGGPIVMNTREELNKAFEDLEKGTFLQKEIEY
ncbi:MAG: pirin family protein [Spirochaetaceae bacterium]|nr:pirin family protein [Spirochaetaceae bacterium]